MKKRNDYVDFSDTKTAFSDKDDRELRKALWLFRMMNKQWLVDVGTIVAEWALRWKIPLAKTIIKSTIFDQFVGGETLKESESSIARLWSNNILTVLDYGAEGKSSEEDLDNAQQQFVRSVIFAATNESTPVVSIKVSALAPNHLLEEVQQGKSLSIVDEQRWRRVKDRVNVICSEAFDNGVRIFIDAEESWIQDPIDELVESMMEQYNRKVVVVYQTFQMYRTDRYEYLQRLYTESRAKGYVLGAKLVRGAYMEKERERAEELGYVSPIHNTKADTDTDYDKALVFCIDRFDTIASCAATHNASSCLLQAQIIGDRKLKRNHSHLNFCQLYGMSDHITYNLASKGYNVAKYVVYGKVEEVVPYLSRRADENTATKGEFGREYQLLVTEYRRRKKALS